MLRVTIVAVLAMALPVAISLGGPIYYGYTNGPYLRVVVWAAACTIAAIWFYRQSFTAASATGLTHFP